jgi:Pyridoxamine 5'-phosphate oxidase
MTDNNAHARTVLDGTCYAVLATADADGMPWATPVWFAHDDLDRIYWLSWPGSRHSQLIERRPEIALTVFDTNAVPNEGTAFYATAHARQCSGEQVDDGLRILNRRSLAQGLGEFTRERVTGGSRLRLYVAEIAEAWVLDQDADVDQRAPVPR